MMTVTRYPQTCTMKIVEILRQDEDRPLHPPGRRGPGEPGGTGPTPERRLRVCPPAASRGRRGTPLGPAARPEPGGPAPVPKEPAPFPKERLPALRHPPRPQRSPHRSWDPTPTMCLLLLLPRCFTPRRSGLPELPAGRLSSSARTVRPRASGQEGFTQLHWQAER